jgi:hypothetical protein
VLILCAKGEQLSGLLYRTSTFHVLILCAKAKYSSLSAPGMNCCQLTASQITCISLICVTVTGPDSSVSIVTTLQTGESENWGSVSREGIDFSLCCSLQIGSYPVAEELLQCDPPALISAQYQRLRKHWRLYGCTNQ